MPPRAAVAMFIGLAILRFLAAPQWRIVIPFSDLNQRYPRFGVEFLLKATRALSKNQFAGRTHPSLKQMTSVGRTVATSHHHVRVHLRLSVLESDVANQRKQFHLFVEDAGWIVFFRFPVEP